MIVKVIIINIIIIIMTNKLDVYYNLYKRSISNGEQ